MKNTYQDLIEQTFEFPQEGFKEEGGELHFYDVVLMDLIKQYGTPLKLTYLPRIREQITQSRQYFAIAIAKTLYGGAYHYSYCTKSSHYAFVLEAILETGADLETSSAFDLNIIENLQERGLFDQSRLVICNGFKQDSYLEGIARLHAAGFENMIVVLDNMEELERLCALIEKPIQIGMRIAAEEDPKFEFYTSRLGICYNDILPFYENVIQKNGKVKLKMLHFFINTGIADTAYYWNELHKCIDVYASLKQGCADLKYFNLGGGFPIKDSLAFKYDFEYMAEEIIRQIQKVCKNRAVAEPDIVTEFGSYTVGESGAILYSVLTQKQQNDREKWNMIDGSMMNTLPDSWAINRRFIMLPINNWDQEYERILLGGLTCDSDDYYNSETHLNAIYLPKLKPESTQYLGFFHTGAYQDSISGVGGVQHCLLPSPKHIIVDRDENGVVFTKLFAKEQSFKSMMKILGY